jgi:glycosyltransferase involved in cell wall biosynthesis
LAREGSAAIVTEAPRLSVVAPVYDERDNLEPLVRELTAVLEPLGPYEILLVDDGSTDGSGDRIAELAQRYPRSVRGLHFRENRGQTAAFDAGFRAARGAIVVTIDADLQNDPKDIERLVAALDQADVAVGYRLQRHDPWLRRVSATIANAVRNRATGDDIKDTGCSLKAFRRECLAGLRLYAGLHRFLPTLLRMDGWRVVQLPVEHRPRASGASKYGVWNRLFPALADLLAVRWMRRRRLDYEVVRHDP